MSFDAASKAEREIADVCSPMSVLNTSRSASGLLFVLFFVSGFSGLVY